MSFFSDEEKDVVSVDGTEVYTKSHEEDLTKEGGTDWGHHLSVVSKSTTN